MNFSTLNVAVIGAGRLAWSLIANFQQAGIPVRQLISRSENKRQAFAQAYAIPHLGQSPKDLLPDTDLVILSVSDHAIAEVALQLKGTIRPEAAVFHTSGSIDLETLLPAGGQIGVFYPLQMFTPRAVVDFRTIPLFIEGTANTLPLLRRLAESVSDRVVELNSADRLRLHLGAVFACNFPNYLYQLTHQLMPQQAEMDFRIYEPLVREQINRVFESLPENTQTGPAIRGDQVTLQKHLDLLQDQPDIRALYQRLSQRINADLEL